MNRCRKPRLIPTTDRDPAGTIILVNQLRTGGSRGAPQRRAQIIGTGLIGGSVGLALRQRGWHVTGSDIAAGHSQRALELGVIDEIGLDSEAEFALVAVPAAALVEQVALALRATKGLVTDTGSVKTSVARAINDPRFVPGHPMAGSEQDGVNGADPAIFQGSVWALTPTEDTDDDALHALQAVLASFGSDVITMNPERHDSLVAVVSHVPHLTAASLMCLADDRSELEAPLLRLAAGGFRDMTRIAAGHPGIWLDICDENRDVIVSVLDEMTTRLQDMRNVVAAGDRQRLGDILTQARRARTNLPARYVRPDELIEVRVPIPDRKGQIAAITMCAADNDVNVTDIEVAHSPEGERGVLVMLVPIGDADRLVTALSALDYYPTTRKLA